MEKKTSLAVLGLLVLLLVVGVAIMFLGRDKTPETVTDIETIRRTREREVLVPVEQPAAETEVDVNIEGFQPPEEVPAEVVTPPQTQRVIIQEREVSIPAAPPQTAGPSTRPAQHAVTPNGQIRGEPNGEESLD